MLDAVAVQNSGSGIPESGVILRSMASSGTCAKSPTGFMIDRRTELEGTVAAGYEIGHGDYQRRWRDRLEQDAGSYRPDSLALGYYSHVTAVERSSRDHAYRKGWRELLQ